MIKKSRNIQGNMKFKNIILLLGLTIITLSGCKNSTLTLKNFVEVMLREVFGDEIEVMVVT